MIVIAEARQLSMKEALSHPLGPLPCSLAASDGSLNSEIFIGKTVTERCSGG